MHSILSAQITAGYLLSFSWTTNLAISDVYFPCYFPYFALQLERKIGEITRDVSDCAWWWLYARMVGRLTQAHTCLVIMTQGASPLTALMLTLPQVWSLTPWVLVIHPFPPLYIESIMCIFVGSILSSSQVIVRQTRISSCHKSVFLSEIYVLDHSSFALLHRLCIN